MNQRPGEAQQGHLSRARRWTRGEDRSVGCLCPGSRYSKRRARSARSTMGLGMRIMIWSGTARPLTALHPHTQSFSFGHLSPRWKRRMACLGRNCGSLPPRGRARSRLRRAPRICLMRTGLCLFAQRSSRRMSWPFGILRSVPRYQEIFGHVFGKSAAVML